jgi:hypothetical protein
LELAMSEARFEPPPFDGPEYIDRIGHQWKDIPRRVAGLAAEMGRLQEYVDKVYAEDAQCHGVNWREYAKLLASRIRAQRGEIGRLHKKVRELRADVHERDERIKQMEAGA